MKIDVWETITRGHMVSVIVENVGQIVVESEQQGTEKPWGEPQITFTPEPIRASMWPALRDGIDLAFKKFAERFPDGNTRCQICDRIIRDGETVQRTKTGVRCVDGTIGCRSKLQIDGECVIPTTPAADWTSAQKFAQGLVGFLFEKIRDRIHDDASVYEEVLSLSNTAMRGGEAGIRLRMKDRSVVTLTLAVEREADRR